MQSARLQLCWEPLTDESIAPSFADTLVYDQADLCALLYARVAITEPHLALSTELPGFAG